jgi:hypothetical protein
MEMELYKDEHAGRWQKFLEETDWLRDFSYYVSKYDRPCGNIRSSLMLLQENGRIIGQISSLADQAWLRNRMVTIRTLVDLYVKTEFPGYGLHLLLSYLSRFPDNLFLCVPNQQAAPLYEKLEWRNISSIFKRYFFPIDIQHVTRLRLHCRIPRIVNSTFRCFFHSYIELQKLRTKRDNTYEICTDFTKFFGNKGVRRLWTEGRAAGLVSSVTAEHFKIYNSPLLGKVLFISVSDKQRRPKAACVMVFDHRMHAEITEYAGEEEALKFLIVIALEAVVNQEGKLLAVNTTVSEHGRLLKRLLFLQAGEVNAYLYSRDPALRAEVNQLRSFSLTSGICDNWLQ